MLLKVSKKITDVKVSFLLNNNTHNKLLIGLTQKGVYYEQEKKKFFY